MQQAAALEVLDHQRAGRTAQAEAWRVMITLPQFANADDGGLLLQQPSAEASQPGVTEALAKEYVAWQVTRVRQLLDGLQRAIASDSVDEAFLAASLSEVRVLSQFPASVLEAAGLKPAGTADAALPTLTVPYTSDESVAKLASWRDGLEETLPNLLKPADVTRLERLLVRFVSVVPKEYRNGVENGRVLIPLEYQEGVQFIQQAQGLVNELAPTWRRDLAAPYKAHHAELVTKLATLAKQVDQMAELSAVESSANDVVKILEGDFGLSARRSGDKGQIVEETALDVREALGNSLAAAQAGHWQEAESLRLDAYTSFDSEIEVRVLPRNPALANTTERSFIDGTDGSPGIKALLDRAAPVEELDGRLRPRAQEHGRLRGDPQGRRLAGHGQLHGVYHHRAGRSGSHRHPRGAPRRDARGRAAGHAALGQHGGVAGHRGQRPDVLAFQDADPVARPLRREAGGGDLHPGGDHPADGHELGLSTSFIGWAGTPSCVRSPRRRRKP